MAMKDVLGEAIRLAEDGFPVSELSARFWKACEPVIREGSENFGELLKGGKRSPACGEIMKMPGLVRAFKRLANEGKKGFYEGDVAEAIVNAVRKKGGVMSLEDLRMYGEDGCQEVDPISLEWGDTKIWECAPNGQGIVALMALGIIEALEEKDAVQKIGGPQEGWGHNQTEYVHSVPSCAARKKNC
jgi:gamma-glutamyltranspeptidase/glutathione hydrolase